MLAADKLSGKRLVLDEHIRSRGRTLVAYSGGVDSAFLAWATHRALGDNMIAVIADSPSLARFQLADAIDFAKEQEIPLEVLATHELDRAEYARNDAFRCFHCKDELFSRMEEFRREHSFDSITYGLNKDDQADFRPGQMAGVEHNVGAPLRDAGLSKPEIRELAHRAGLRIWDKPASACLSSRIEYGRAVTPTALSMVEQGEDTLRGLGFRQFRVRHHGDIVRIEIAREEMSRALDLQMVTELTRIFKAIGFKFVTLDLEGFRSGSMNDLLAPEDLMRRTD